MRRSRITYGVLCLVMVWFFIMYQNYVSFLGLGFCLVLPLGLFLYVNALREQVRVWLDTRDVLGNRGRDIPIKLQVSNDSMMAMPFVEITLQIKYGFYAEEKTLLLEVPLKPKEKRILQVDLQPMHVGNLQLKVGRIRVLDFFRLTAGRARKTLVNTVTVLPYVPDSLGMHLSDDFLRSSDDVTHFSPYKPGDDASETFVIREYRPGDKMHRIHWKLSAKTSDVMVRQASFPIENSVAIYTELYCPARYTPDDKSCVDGVLETTYMMSLFLLQSGIEHQLHWFDHAGGGPCSAEIADEGDLFAAMSEMFTGSLYWETPLMAKEMVKDPARVQANRVLYITPKLFEELDNLPYSLQRKTVMFYCHVGQPEDSPVWDRYRIIEIDAADPQPDFMDLVL